MRAFLLLAFVVAVKAVTNEQYNADLLAEHNKYRALHGVPALVLDESLVAFAMNFTQYLADNDKFFHNTDNSLYGENIFWSSAYMSAADVVEAWYSEEADYSDFSSEPDTTDFTSGHFTQMIWKSTTQMGCGMAIDDELDMTVVCNYSPAGNYVDEFVANVPAPLSN